MHFTSLAPYETSTAVDVICKNYNRVLDTQEIDAFILVFVFIHCLFCIYPFNGRNGRMSRLLTTLLLYRLGYFNRNVVKEGTFICKKSRNGN